VERLVQIYEDQLGRGVRPEVRAAWIHHAFTQIHPFQDGNGRVARTLATLVFIKSGFFPLVVNRDDRERYIDALEAADQGDMLPLIELFSQVEKRALTKAIGKAVEFRPVESVDDALNATRDMLVGLNRIIPKEYLAAKQLASVLVQLSQQRFGQVSRKLSEDIAQVDSTFHFSFGMLAQAPTNEIRVLAEKLKYDPNVSDFHASPLLTLKARDLTSRIVISFHGTGAAFRGLLVAVGYFQTENEVPTALSQDVFRISYQDSQNELVPRFEKWLDGCIIEGIAQWRRTLV